MGTVANARVRALPVVENPWNLTPVEYWLSHQLAEGKTNGELAEALCLSIHTISEYHRRAKSKVGAKTLHHLTALIASYEAGLSFDA